MCDFKNHNLKELYSFHEGYDAWDVVRWCADCGAVVIDINHDNRTFTGRVMKMKFPKLAKEKYREIQVEKDN